MKTHVFEPSSLHDINKIAQLTYRSFRKYIRYNTRMLIEENKKRIQTKLSNHKKIAWINITDKIYVC